MAAVFPALAACQENAGAGPVPDPRPRPRPPDPPRLPPRGHGRRRSGGDAPPARVRCRTRVHFVESTEPSVLVPRDPEREALHLPRRRPPGGTPEPGRPDAPGAPPPGRRRWPSSTPTPSTGSAPRRHPTVRGPEELHDLLLSLLVLRPQPEYGAWFEALADTGRAMAVDAAGRAVTQATPDTAEHGTDRTRCGAPWSAGRLVAALFPAAVFVPTIVCPRPWPRPTTPDADTAAADTLRGHLDVTGPITVAVLSRPHGAGREPGEGGTGAARGRGLRHAGRLRSRALPAGRRRRGARRAPVHGEEQWCARRLLARIHAYTQHKLRREIEPVTAQDLMRFLLRWHHVAPGSQRTGRAGVMAVVDQLQGFEIAAGRLGGGDPPRPGGELPAALARRPLPVGRARLGPPGAARRGRGRRRPPRARPPRRVPPRSPSPCARISPGFSKRHGATPLATEPVHGAGRDVLDALRRARSHVPLAAARGHRPAPRRGGGRALGPGGPGDRHGRRVPGRPLPALGPPGLEAAPPPRTAQPPGGASGADATRGRRGALGPSSRARTPDDPDALAEQVAGQLLARWGVVFWDLMARENLALPWREVVWALRRLEARGLVRGGRFVTGFAGEQYALPEADRRAPPGPPHAAPRARRSA